MERDWKPKRIPRGAVPDALVESGEYRGGGYACPHGDFETHKVGLEGKQSVRAHLKKHKNDTRAIRRSLAIQVVVALAYTVAVVIHTAGWNPSVAIASVPLASDAIGATSIAVVAILLLLLQLSVSNAKNYASRGDVKTAGRLLTMLNLLGVGGILVALGLIDPELPVAWFAPLLIALAYSLYLAPVLALARLAAKRGEFRSPRYGELVRPRDEDAEIKLIVERSSLRRRILDGSLDPRRATGEMKQFLTALGLMGVRPRKPTRPVRRAATRSRRDRKRR